MLLSLSPLASFIAITFTFQSANAFGNDIIKPRLCRGPRSKIIGGLLRHHDVRSSSSPGYHRRTTLSLRMVRNVDLPEAIVFYGLESVLEPPSIVEEEVASEDDSDDAQPHDNHLKLRSGIFRILQECQEVGTAVLILSEVDGLKDGELHNVFKEAWMNNSYSSDSIIEKKLQTLLLSDDAEENSTVSFRCIDTKFTIPPSCPNDVDDEFDDNDSYASSSYYYNLLSRGKSPSPAFLLDSLQSVRIDPRGFGGSSGFARGQWVEPRRCPLTARTVVFVAGDWKSGNNYNYNNNNNLPWLENYWDEEGKITSSVRDRCAAARAAGCRIVYL